MNSKSKILVITPTYNEAENIVSFIDAVLKSSWCDILVVDDASPDGTADKIEDLRFKIKDGSRINLIQRSGKLGLGTAYHEGFSWALKHNYDFVISMDADFSHDPKDLPKLINAPDDIDLVIGSRYVKGGKIVGWGMNRFINSYLANWVTRLMLGLKPKDATAGFKRYSKKFLTSLQGRTAIASGYAFQVEMVFFAKVNRYKIIEVPITFVDRRVGQSKISGELKKSAQIVWKLFIRRHSVKQFIKFSIVGFINAIIDWIFFAILKIPLAGFGQVGKQIAKAGSFTISANSSYYFNRKWTFRSNDRQIARQVIKFFVVASIGLVVNNLIFYLVTSATGLGWSDIAGLIIGTSVVMFWNFGANKFWTFKQ